MFQDSGEDGWPFSNSQCPESPLVLVGKRPAQAAAAQEGANADFSKPYSRTCHTSCVKHVKLNAAESACSVLLSCWLPSAQPRRLTKVCAMRS